MKKLCCMLFAFLIITSCNKPSYYAKISAKEYKMFVATDTLYNNHKILATHAKPTEGRFIYDATLVRFNKNNKINYYKLNADTYFENDSILKEYQGFFSASDSNGGFQQNGIWFYADFYKDALESGVRFAVDSLPPGYTDKNRPNAEGLYYFNRNNLQHVTGDQSEEAFYELNKNGFYFVPNSGRFFKRHHINELK